MSHFYNAVDLHKELKKANKTDIEYAFLSSSVQEAKNLAKKANLIIDNIKFEPNQKSCYTYKSAKFDLIDANNVTLQQVENIVNRWGSKGFTLNNLIKGILSIERDTRTKHR